MITHHDWEYKATKRIKQGRAKLDPAFRELAEWVSNQWSVTVVNVIYDGRCELHAPRLQIVLEYAEHVRGFCEGLNFNKKKQEAIAGRFIELASRHPGHGFDLDGLFAVFSAFEPLAIEEAIAQISDREIRGLMKRIGNPDLWLIDKCFSRVTFMFYTEKQVERYTRLGKQQEYALLYASILKRYDEFDYLEPSEFQIFFDSKENFVRKYKGSWLNYHR